MRVKFISSDGLSLECNAPYPFIPRLRRPMKNKRVAIDSPASIKDVLKTREYEYVGTEDGIAIYEEIT